MKFFSRKKMPAQHGLELSRRLKKASETIPDALKSIGEDELFNLGDIESRKPAMEGINGESMGSALEIVLCVVRI